MEGRMTVVGHLDRRRRALGADRARREDLRLSEGSAEIAQKGDLWDQARRHWDTLAATGPHGSTPK